MKVIIFTILCSVWIHESQQLAHDRNKWAEVELLSAEGQHHVGKLTLHYDGTLTHIYGRVSGLQPGLHGFHIHEKGDLSNKCVGAGGHFNPENKHHGGPTDSDRHVGDLGNIEAMPDGVAVVKIEDHLVSLNGPHDVTGRAFVVHALADDLGKGGHEDSLTTGHAGARVACGIIREKHN